MILWLDAQLSPALASWITETFELEALSVRRVGLLSATWLLEIGDSTLENAE